MNDYCKIFSQGMSHVQDCGNVWSKRRDKLVSAWCRDMIPGLGVTTIYMSRCNHLVGVLEDRLNTLSKMISEFKEKQKQDKIQADHMQVMIQCYNINCRYSPVSYGMAMYAKNYIPGSHKCEKCGLYMETKEEHEVGISLMRAGIKVEK